MLDANKLFKFLGYVVIYAITFLQCYCMSLLVSGALLSMYSAILSIVTGLPKIFIERFWLIYLLASIPIAIVFFITVITGTFNTKQYKKKL